jgi:hypothetical protein
MGGELSGGEGPSANQAGADAQRNRADDRVVARDGDEAASGFPEKATSGSLLRVLSRSLAHFH